MTRNEINVGLDDSPSGRAALSWAARQAVLAESLLRAIHVLDWPYGLATDPEVNMSQPSQDEIDDSYRSSITTVFEQASPHPDWQLEFARGDAGPVLVREAKNAQLLVVGTREHVGLGRLLVGSISHYCLTHATCAVVAVRAETS